MPNPRSTEDEKVSYYRITTERHHLLKFYSAYVGRDMADLVGEFIASTIDGLVRDNPELEVAFAAIRKVHQDKTETEGS